MFSASIAFGAGVLRSLKKCVLVAYMWRIGVGVIVCCVRYMRGVGKRGGVEL